MRRRRGVADNPLLVGVATVAIAMLLVFVSYNANSGLPFVPTYELKVEIPSGANLVHGADVRIGGARVGQVSTIIARRRGDRVWAEAALKLDQKQADLPVDSAVLVRPRSAIGTKYIEITEGSSNKGVPDGGTLPLQNAHPRPVEIDQVFNTFSNKARAGQKRSIIEFGTGLAGRGSALNEAFGKLNPLLTHLMPVMVGLTDPNTRFDRFFGALSRAAAAVAPVAPQQGELIANLDLTFGALASVTEPIQRLTAQSPEAFDTFTRELPGNRPFLRKVTALGNELQPGFADLPVFAAALADMVNYGTPAVEHAARTTPKVGRLFDRFAKFGNDPLVNNGVLGLRRLAGIARGPLAFITPSQTVCNYPALFFHNLAGLMQDNDGVGAWLRIAAVLGSTELNSEMTPSSAPANGSEVNRLHSNPYPNTAAPGQTRECEAGNEGFDPSRQVIGNIPGNQGTKTAESPIVDKQAVKK